MSLPFSSLSFPQLMGVLNVTPDSFSGDGLLKEEDYIKAAIKQADQMIAQGAQWLDIGGESTRPGSVPVDCCEEIRRTAPVIQAIHARHKNVPLSIDTTKPDVARSALESGARMINDVSGAAMDSAMFDLAAQYDARLVLMHNQASAERAQQDPRIGGEYQPASYNDFFQDVTTGLSSLAKRARQAGVAKEKIIVDPGIGFGKTVAQNLCLINEVDRLASLGFPVLLAASRKSFIGRVLNLPPDERLEGTAAVVAVATLRGVSFLRVHDVLFMSRIIKMVQALMTAKREH